MKSYRVWTYYYPDEEDTWKGEPILCYLRRQRQGPIHPDEKSYDIEAESGREAKRLAYRMRKSDEGLS